MFNKKTLTAVDTILLVIAFLASGVFAQTVTMTPVPAGGSATNAQSSTTTITVNWAGFTLAADHYALIIYNSSTVVFATADTATGGSAPLPASATTYTNSALSLANGVTYAVWVYSHNALHTIVQSASTTILIDTAAPSGGTVTNNGGGVVSGAFQSSTTYINASWASWGDATAGMFAGSSTYSVGIVTSNGTQVYALSPFSNAASTYAFTNLALASGTKYYVVMTAKDAVGNTTAIIYSNGVTADTAAPTNGAVNNTNFAGTTITAQNLTNVIYASWSGFSQALSGVASYSVGVLKGGTGAGSTYIVPLTTYASTTSSATFAGLALTSVGVYYIAMQATSNTGFTSSLVYSSGVLVDTDTPFGGTITNNGGGTASGGFQSSGSTINAGWANWGDTIGAISTYQVGIQISGGAVVYALSPFSAATSTYAFTNLSLTSGTKYYVIFVATDAAGNATSIYSSNTITVDTAPPTGTITANGGAPFQKSGNTFNLSWSFSDAVSGMLIGANTYQVGVVTSAGATIVPFTNFANTASSASFTGLTLTNGAKYYGVIIAQDAVGNTTGTIFSNGVTVDLDAPGTGIVTNTSGLFQASSTTINVNWANFSDVTSGMLIGSNTYRVGVGTAPGANGALGGTTIVSLTNFANTASSATFGGLSLTNGNTYYITLVASDVAGNTSTFNSAPFTVDTVAPTGNVYDGNIPGLETNFQLSLNTLSVNWANWGDTVSGMALAANTYMVGFGTTPGATNVVALQPFFNTASSATFTGLSLTPGAKYFAIVIGKDSVGNATAIYSNGIIVGSTLAAQVFDGAIAGVETSIQGYSNNTLSANWIYFSNFLSGITAYSVGVVTAPLTGSYVVPLVNYANTTASATFSGLTLTNAATYYAQVTATNGSASVTVYSNGVTINSQLFFAPISITPSAGILSFVTNPNPITFPKPPPSNISSFPYGMFAFSISGVAPGALVYVTITLSAALQVTPQWLWYNTILNTYTVIPTANIVTADDKTFIIALKDGGFGDMDGLANGTIVDPIGPGILVVPNVPGQASTFNNEGTGFGPVHCGAVGLDALALVVAAYFLSRLIRKRHTRSQFQK